MKKLNRKLIIILMAMFMLLSLCGCGNNSDSENNETSTDEPQGSDPQVDVANEEADFDTTTWIDFPLNVIYQIPLAEQKDEFLRSLGYRHESHFSRVTEFGTRFHWDGGSVYVEKSIDGHKDLNTLHIDINAEKQEEGRLEFYASYDTTSKIVRFDDFRKKEFEENKNVKVGNIDAVYFKTKPNDDFNVSGYNFMFDGMPVSVYSITHSDSDYRDIDDPIMRNIILTMDHYDGTSRIQNYGGNVAAYYKDGITIYDTNYESKIVMDNMRQINGFIQNFSKPLVRVELDEIEWDGQLETIFEATQHPTMRKDDDGNDFVNCVYDFAYNDFSRDDNYNWTNDAEIEILEEEKINLGGIEMMHYFLDTNDWCKYCEVYTFIYEGYPYVFSYNFNVGGFIRDEYYSIYDLPEDENEETKRFWTTYVGILKNQSKALLSTIHILEDGEYAFDFYGKD